MTAAEALRILNNNQDGRVYTERDAERLIKFYSKLSAICTEGVPKLSQTGKLKSA